MPTWPSQNHYHYHFQCNQCDLLAYPLLVCHIHHDHDQPILTWRILRVAVANLAAKGCRESEMLRIVILIVNTLFDTGFAINDKDSWFAINGMPKPCRLKSYLLTLEYDWKSHFWRSSKTVVLQQRTLRPGLQSQLRLLRTWDQCLVQSSLFRCPAPRQETAWKEIDISLKILGGKDHLANPCLAPLNIPE